MKIHCMPHTQGKVVSVHGIIQCSKPTSPKSTNCERTDQYSNPGVPMSEPTLLIRTQELNGALSLDQDQCSCFLMTGVKRAMSTWKLSVSDVAQLASETLSNQTHCPNSALSRVKTLPLGRGNSSSHFHTLIFL